MWITPNLMLKHYKIAVISLARIWVMDFFSHFFFFVDELIYPYFKLKFERKKNKQSFIELNSVLNGSESQYFWMTSPNKSTLIPRNKEIWNYISCAVSIFWSDMNKMRRRVSDVLQWHGLISPFIEVFSSVYKSFHAEWSPKIVER